MWQPEKKVSSCETKYQMQDGSKLRRKNYTKITSEQRWMALFTNYDSLEKTCPTFPRIDCNFSIQLYDYVILTTTIIVRDSKITE